MGYHPTVYRFLGPYLPRARDLGTTLYVDSSHMWVSVLYGAYRRCPGLGGLLEPVLEPFGGHILRQRTLGSGLYSRPKGALGLQGVPETEACLLSRQPESRKKKFAHRYLYTL